MELFFGNVSSGQGNVLLDADENGISRVPYIHQGFGVYDFTQRHGILVKDVSEAEAEVDRINRKEFTHTASNQDVLAEDPSLWQTFQEKLDAKICMIQYVTRSASDYGITNEGRFFYEATRYDGTLAEGSGAICGIQVDRDGSKNTALLIQNDGKRMLAEFQARGGWIVCV